MSSPKKREKNASKTTERHLCISISHTDRPATTDIHLFGYLCFLFKQQNVSSFSFLCNSLPIRFKLCAVVTVRSQLKLQLLCRLRFPRQIHTNEADTKWKRKNKKNAKRRRRQQQRWRRQQKCRNVWRCERRLVSQGVRIHTHRTSDIERDRKIH